MKNSAFRFQYSVTTHRLSQFALRGVCIVFVWSRGRGSATISSVLRKPPDLVKAGNAETTGSGVPTASVINVLRGTRLHERLSSLKLLALTDTGSYNEHRLENDATDFMEAFMARSWFSYSSNSNIPR